MNRALKIFVSFFGLGFLPKMPGTWGSLGALPLGYLLFQMAGPQALMAIAFFLFIVSCWVIPLYMAHHSYKKDPQEIVIDEVVGMLIPLSLCQNNPLLILAAFMAFRFFDITKVWPANWAETLGGSPAKQAVGIMLDDVIAGIYAAIIIYGLKMWIF